MKVYKLVNNVNGDFYVGKTTQSLNKRLSNHRNTANHGSTYYLHNAMRYYGYNNFTIELLEETTNEQELNEREIHWISELKPTYNMHVGGQGGSLPGRPDIVGESRENWLSGFNRKGKTPWNKGKTGLGGYKWSQPMSDEKRKQISEFQKQNRAQCIHCGIVTNPGNIGRYHNDKCSKK